MKYSTEIALSLTLILCILSAWYGQFWQAAQRVQDEVLRLHILANSDSEADQNLKLAVRDRLLEESESWFAQSGDKASAEELLQANLPQIAQIAQDEIISKGYDYPVTVQLCSDWFSTRIYEDFTLPSGDYDALRVIIGEGEGQNWWCVLFPSLCLSAAGEDWFARQDLQILQTSPRYEPRFAILEWVEKIKIS